MYVIMNSQTGARSAQIRQQIRPQEATTMVEQKNIWVAAGDGDLDRVKVSFLSSSPSFSYKFHRN